MESETNSAYLKNVERINKLMFNGQTKVWVTGKSDIKVNIMSQLAGDRCLSFRKKTYACINSCLKKW